MKCAPATEASAEKRMAAMIGATSHDASWLHACPSTTILPT